MKQSRVIWSRVILAVAVVVIDGFIARAVLTRDVESAVQWGVSVALILLLATIVPRLTRKSVRRTA